MAGLVRQNFQGIPLSAQGQSIEPAVPALSTGNNPNRQAYNKYLFQCGVIGPRDDSIPRGNVRQDLLNAGRIVQISLGRGTQEAGSLRALNGAPFLRGETTK